MKESISSTVLLIIVIVLVILFAGIVSFSANRSNSFTVKDKIVSIIEHYGYFDLSSSTADSYDDPVLTEIVDVVNSASYRQVGNCEEVVSKSYDLSKGNVSYSAYTRDGQKAFDDTSAAFCIVRVNGPEVAGVNSYYYRVISFYNLSIPVINSFFNFYNIGETKALFK